MRTRPRRRAHGPTDTHRRPDHDHWPDARRIRVYLNGSGEELTKSDGTGAFWVEHSWVLDGEGYNNCELLPAPTEILDYDEDCRPAVGAWQDDELTMRVGLEGPADSVVLFYNERRPLLDRDPVVYQVRRVDPLPGSEPFVIEFACAPDVASPLDGTVLGCPAP